METFDLDVVDKIYTPYDNLVLAVTLHEDGRSDKRILGSLTEAIKAQYKDSSAWSRLKEIFMDPGLQMVSFTITEKGYALRNAQGDYMAYVKADMENGPESVTGAMGIVTSLLHTRFQAGRLPLALVSMDNMSHNGEKLRQSVLETAQVWAEKGFVEQEFVNYVQDETIISFPWSMIDKITPRPSQTVAESLAQAGKRGS